MSLHDYAIDYVSLITHGENNHSNPKLRFKGKNKSESIIPDVVSRHVIHEVEVFSHKFDDGMMKKYDRVFKYPNSFQYGFEMKIRPKKKVCWIIIENYHNLKKIFDEIRVLVDDEENFEEFNLIPTKLSLRKDSLCRRCPNMLIGASKIYCTERKVKLHKGYMRCNVYPKKGEM